MLKKIIISVGLISFLPATVVKNEDQYNNNIKDSGSLYVDTSHNVNQHIQLHNIVPPPAKIITKVVDRRIPVIKYYNVYKDKIVYKDREVIEWRCRNKPNVPNVPNNPNVPNVPKQGWGESHPRIFYFSGSVIGKVSKGWHISKVKNKQYMARVCSPCGCKVMGGFYQQKYALCGVTVKTVIQQGRGGRGLRIYIPAGSH